MKMNELTNQELDIMDHCKDSDNVIMHSILCVKVEPFEKDEDCTQNLDPLQPDSDAHTQMELLQDFKTEIESDSSDQAMNDLIQEDILKNKPGDTGTEIEEVNIKIEYIDNEASLGDVLDSRRIIEDDTSVHSQHSGNISNRTEHGTVTIQKQTDEKNITRYELSHSCEPQRYDVNKEEPTNDANILNTTSPANHSRARSDTCSSGVDVPRIHKPSTSDEERSKQSSSLSAHLQRHSSYVCDVCDMEFKNSRNLVKHKVVHTGQKLHACNICKKGFSNSSHLIRHKRTHTGLKLYVCDICKKGFDNSSHLVRHERIHTGEKLHSCDICKKGFSDSSALVKHKRIHTGEKPYVCAICKKGFSDSSHLVAHKRIHTGQKPYVCDICKKGFGHSSHLVTHKRIHTGQKPFACDICKKGFRDPSTLVKHKRIHTGQKPYVCDICKKGFSQSSALVKHTRIHTGKKPYICDNCKKEFSDSSALIRHKRIHTGQKPYDCDICNKGFSQSSNLVSHIRTHHAQKPHV